MRMAKSLKKRNFRVPLFHLGDFPELRQQGKKSEGIVEDNTP